MAKLLSKFLITFLAALFALYSVSWYFARGARTFFSPHTLESFGQSEVLLPFTDVPIYRSAPGDPYHFKLVAFLVEREYWSPSRNAEVTEKLLLTSRWNYQWLDGQSNFHKEFTTRAEKWMSWTDDNPEIAARLWPEVLASIRREQDYWLAESLMQHAQMSSTTDEFTQRVAADAELAGVPID